ncbi:MAG: hypothetical protein AB7U29_19035 [Desulfobulbus sp.]
MRKRLVRALIDNPQKLFKYEVTNASTYELAEFNFCLLGWVLMNSKNVRIQAIIHLATITAGTIGGGLANIPGSDMAPLTALQTAMVVAIAHEHGQDITKSTAKSLLLTFPGGYGGRAISQYLTSWIIGYGNLINAATAITITEAIGWTAHSYFSSRADESQSA